MWTFFEAKNGSKAITRLGDIDHGTDHLERLAMLNSYALQVGYKEDEVPFKNLSSPTADVTSKEYMGFSYQFQKAQELVECPILPNLQQLQVVT